MTRYHLLVEDIEPNHWVAFVRELTGCFGPARTLADAVARMPDRIRQHLNWLAQRGNPRPVSEIGVEVAEVFNSFPAAADPDYIVNAFFEDDRHPLTPDEVDYGLWLLTQNRRDLMEAVSGLSNEQLTRPFPTDPQQSITRILKHVAGAESWYFDRFGLSPARSSLSDEPLAYLADVRANTVSQLPMLVGETRTETLIDEQWSARKILRRALWHERDHIEQIVAHRSSL